MLALEPDVVVIATGGAPNVEFLDSGGEFAVTSWDLLSGAARPSGEVIVYDDNGAHPGLTAAEFVAESGAKLEIVTPERMLAPDVGGTSYPPYFRAFSRADAKVSLNLRLESIARRGNRVVGVFYDEYGRRRVEKEADMIVVEHGAVPVDDLYFELKAGSVNRGEVDYDALIAGRPQTVVSNPDGALSPVPDRRRGGEPQHSRRGLRRDPADEGHLMAANLITDVDGVRVGSADDARLASGVTVVLFDEPAVASIAINGGAPALRDTALLEPEMTVERVDGFVLSGGSAFGLDAAGGAMAYLAEIGRGFEHRGARVPIVPGASLFDLLNGGDKAWGRKPPYWDLGLKAASTAAVLFALGTAGAGYGATTYNLKGGLGSASAVTSSGFRVGALVVVNSVGRATRGESLHFWAAPYERDAEFGGLGFGPKEIDDHLTLRLKSDTPSSTDLAVVVTDAALTTTQLKRVAIMAQDGYALALRPAHAPMDNDVVFAAATARASVAPDLRDLTEIGMLAAECVARAVARGVYEASPLAIPDGKPTWRQRRAMNSTIK